MKQKIWDRFEIYLQLLHAFFSENLTTVHCPAFPWSCCPLLAQTEATFLYLVIVLIVVIMVIVIVVVDVVVLFIC